MITKIVHSLDKMTEALKIARVRLNGLVELRELLDGITDIKKRQSIINLWNENQDFKFKHPPPDNIPKALHILEAKGGGSAELRHCMGLLNKAVSEKRMGQ